MAKVIQLKNENGETYYPVTTGDAVKLEGGGTIDGKLAEFSERVEDMESQVSGVSGKAELFGYRGDVSSPDVEYSVGTILWVSLADDQGSFHIGDTIYIAYRYDPISSSKYAYLAFRKKVTIDGVVTKGQIPGLWVALSASQRSTGSVLVQRIE